MIFRKGGHISKKIKLYIGNNQIEHTKHYTYLGLSFSETTILSQAPIQRYKKAQIALSNLWKILVKLKIQPMLTRHRLFLSLVHSVYSYASPIWLSFTKDSIEKLQNIYARYILQSSFLTPGYILRRELDLIPLEVEMTLSLFKYWIHILNANHNPLLQNAYFMLMNQPSSTKYNWCLYTQSKLNSLGYSFVWSIQSPNLALALLPNIKNRMIDVAMQEDLSRIDYSSHYPNYAKLNACGKSSFLLNFSIPLHLLRTISQIRIHGFPITVDRNFTFLSYSSICKFCPSSRCSESLFHILIICPHFSNLRQSQDFIDLNLPTNFFCFTNYFKFIPLHNLYRFAKVLTSFFKERQLGLNTLTDL